MNTVLDFDLFLREKEEKLLEVRVLGSSYFIKPEIPALIPITLARAAEGLSPEETIRMSLQAADAIFGREAMDEMCRKGLTTGELAELVQKTVGLIRGDEPEDGEILADDAGHVAMRKTPGKK